MQTTPGLQKRKTIINNKQNKTKGVHIEKLTKSKMGGSTLKKQTSKREGEKGKNRGELNENIKQTVFHRHKSHEQTTGKHNNQTKTKGDKDYSRKTSENNQGQD